MLIKGNVLTFTDDKAKRYEIKKRLGWIAAKATGYSCVQENNRQVKGGMRQKYKKKIDVFEDQVKFTVVGHHQ